MPTSKPKTPKPKTRAGRMVMVQFEADHVDALRKIAAADGLALSAWIRMTVLQRARALGSEL